MTYASLKQIQTVTKIEFTAALARLHHFVKLPSGRWTRTLGPPGEGCKHIRGRIWERNADN